MGAEQITAVITAVGVIASLGAVAFQLHQQNVLTRKRVEEEFLRELLAETQRFLGAIRTHIFVIGLLSRWADDDESLPIEARIERALAVRDLRHDIEKYYAAIWRVIALLTALDIRRGARESRSFCEELESLGNSCATLQARVAAEFLGGGGTVRDFDNLPEFNAFIEKSKLVGTLTADRLASLYLKLEFPDA